MAHASVIPNIIKNNQSKSSRCDEWVEERMSRMTLKEKIGQLFIYTVSPYNTKSNKKIIYQAIKNYNVGGLLFSGGQLTNQSLLTNYAQGVSDIPLFISFDGEWGLAMRLNNTPSFPKNRILGSISDNNLIYEYGREMARQCREIGVHINFAPVADIDNNPKNPIINTRSFGGDPDNVSEKVIAYSKGLEDGNVLSVSKHFPGHGDTSVDSHKSLPVLEFDRHRLDSIELVPFKRAVEAGVGGVMIGHLFVPSIGDGAASLSKPVIDILKKDLKFDGLVFSDALTMRGVSNEPNLCSRALIAGCDIILTPKNLKKTLDDVLSAVDSGQLTKEQIDEKCRKVLTYKFYLGLDKPQRIQMAGLEKRIKTERADSLITELYRASVTVLGNRNGAIPLDINGNGNAFIEIGNKDDDTVLFDELHKNMQITKCEVNADSLASINEKLKPYRNIIVVVRTSYELKRYSEWLSSLGDHKNIIYLYLSPIKSFDTKDEIWREASAVILGNSDRVEVQKHIANILMGKGKADGRISVSAGDLFKPGDGVEIKDGMHAVYRPENYGMDSKVLAKIDSVALDGISQGAYPGCQIVVLKDGMPVYDKAFGTYSYKDSTKVTINSIYDLASLTKSTATLLAVMKLYDEGRIGLTDKISSYVPLLKGTNKERITIEELLMHQSGLVSSLPFYKEFIDKSSYKGSFVKSRMDKNHSVQIGKDAYVPASFNYKKEYISSTYSKDYPLQISDSLFASANVKGMILTQIANSPLNDRKYVYSCLNFMLLKEMVENITKKTLDEYLDEKFYKPMRLDRIAYNPLRKFKVEEIVPTVENDYLHRGALLQGYVHDEAAAFMGGVSGNAGLFGNALDVARVYQMIISEGEYNGETYLSKVTCNLFLTYKSKISRRGLGFDKPDLDNPKNSPCAAEADKSVVGHTGFTGTCAWADTNRRLVYVFLSNRINPQPYSQHKLSQLDIRSKIQQLIYQSIK